MRGFSLIELLLALGIGLVLTMMMFQLFHQSERAIRDETLIMEMQQSARVVVAQIADEIRMAGQGVPLYAAGFDTVPSEADAVILGSTGVNRIDFRAGLSNIETAVGAGGSNDFSLGVLRSVAVGTSSGLVTGKFVYLYGPTTGPSWAWLRGEITGTSPTTLTLIPRNTGTTDTFIHFTASPTVALEEAVSIYLSAGSVRRATAVSMSNPSTPVWSAANEIGRNFTDLTFTYYDRNGNVLQPSSLSNRRKITRVDIQVVVGVASPLSNGSRPTYSLRLRSIPRNAAAARPLS
jgi:prepilin-type N-terminal cleavage/methylation domain-containing protein